jgi:hypothetical protein
MMLNLLLKRVLFFFQEITTFSALHQYFEVVFMGALLALLKQDTPVTTELFVDFESI